MTTRWLQMAMIAALLGATAGCALVVEYPLTSASAGVWGATGKGPSDHAISNLTGQDCDLVRVVDLQPICQQHQPAQVEDRAFRPVEATRR